MTNDLERLLNKRAMPKAPGNLAHRIVEAAAERKARKGMNLWEEVMAMFVIPRPAYAFGLTILLGLFVGFGVGGDITTYTGDWDSFLIIDEGGWL